MSMTAAQQRAIIAKESAWVDDSFGGLDLTAFPALNDLPPEEHRDDGRFAKTYGDTPLSSSARDLKRFLDDPDVEALARAGDETGNFDFLREVRDRRGETVAAQFKARCPGYLPTDDNYRAMVQTLAFNGLPVALQNGTTEEVTQELISRGLWTVPNLEAVYNALDREGLLQQPAGTARNLSERERLHVMRLAQTGHTEEAVDQYLRYSLDDEPSVDLLTDPDYRGALDTAVLFVFEAGTADYVPTAERRDFLMRYAAGRPLTLPLLQQAWTKCQANEQRHERGELLSAFQTPQPAEPPTMKEIDALSDEAVDDLYHSSLREYAKSIRGAGILA